MDAAEILGRHGFARAGFGLWRQGSTGRLVQETGSGSAIAPPWLLTTAGGRELGRAWDAGALNRLLDFWRDQR